MLKSLVYNVVRSGVPMAFKWVKKNWDIVTIVAIAVGVSVVFFWLILRPMPVPPGY